MSAGVAVVVVLIVLLAAVGGYFGYKYWDRYCRARALLGDWAGANLEYSSLYEDADGRRASVTSLSLSEIKFTSFTSRPHGFSVSYPAEWSVDAARDAQMPIIAQFKCAQSDRTYKSFSITWEDASWGPVSAQEHANHLMKTLPSAVPGSAILSHARVGVSDYEVVYTVPAGPAAEAVTKLTHITVGNQKVFALVFVCESSRFEAGEEVARAMVSSFKLLAPVGSAGVTGRPVAPPSQRDDIPTEGALTGRRPLPATRTTPTDPQAVEWRRDTSHPAGLSFNVPAAWVRSPLVRSSTPAVEHTCGPSESPRKAFKVTTFDMSTVQTPPQQALKEFLEHFRRSTAQRGSTLLTERVMPSPLGPFPGQPDTPSAVLFKVTSLADGVEQHAAALLGVYRAPVGPTMLGFIANFTTSAEVFKSYEPLAREMFQSIAIDANRNVQSP